MNWSKWFDIDEPSPHSTPAAYQFRILKNREPFPIGRMLGRDSHGILCIGRTANMERRRKQFKCGVINGYGHSEANLFCRIIEFSPALKRLVPNHRLEYQFIRCHSEAQAKKLEARLLKEYLRNYGELPPLNSILHGRYDEPTWKEIANAAKR